MEEEQKKYVEEIITTYRSRKAEEDGLHTDENEEDFSKKLVIEEIKGKPGKFKTESNLSKQNLESYI